MGAELFRSVIDAVFGLVLLVLGIWVGIVLGLLTLLKLAGAPDPALTLFVASLAITVVSGLLLIPRPRRPGDPRNGLTLTLWLAIATATVAGVVRAVQAVAGMLA